MKLLIRGCVGVFIICLFTIDICVAKEFQVPDLSKPLNFKPIPPQKMGDIEYSISNIVWNATVFTPSKIADGVAYQSLNIFRRMWRYVQVPKKIMKPEVFLYLGNLLETTSFNDTKGFYDLDRDIFFINVNKIDLKNRRQMKDILTNASMLRYLKKRTSGSSMPDRRIYLEFRDKFDFSVQFEGYNSPFKQLLSHRKWLEKYQSDSFLIRGTDAAKKAKNVQHFKEAWPLVKDNR